MTEQPEIIPPQPKLKRPTDFTDEIFAIVCDRMAEGEGLRKICDDPEMPSRTTFLRWVEKDTGRQAKYAAAREALMDWYGEEILEIAWDSSRDTIPATDNKPARCDTEWVQRSRLKVDTLKFLMAKLHPRRYGDRLPETVEEKTGVAELMRAIDGKTRGPDKIERIILEGVSPVYGDDGSIINADDNAALRARIAELEERLGMREAKPEPPRQITYDPGPLPSRVEGEILHSIAQAIKRNVPKADQRPAEEVISEVMSEFEKVLQAKYAPARSDQVGGLR